MLEGVDMMNCLSIETWQVEREEEGAIVFERKTRGKRSVPYGDLQHNSTMGDRLVALLGPTPRPRLVSRRPPEAVDPDRLQFSWWFFGSLLDTTFCACPHWSDTYPTTRNAKSYYRATTYLLV